MPLPLNPSSDGAPEDSAHDLREAWSDAARAAAAASRKGRGKGLAARKQLGWAAFKKKASYFPRAAHTYASELERSAAHAKTISRRNSKQRRAASIRKAAPQGFTGFNSILKMPRISPNSTGFWRGK